MEYNEDGSIYEMITQKEGFLTTIKKRIISDCLISMEDDMGKSVDIFYLPLN
jgi:hypothetical protein